MPLYSLSIGFQAAMNILLGIVNDIEFASGEHSGCIGEGKEDEGWTASESD